MKCFALLLLSACCAFGQLTQQEMQPFFRGNGSGPDYCTFNYSNSVTSATNYGRFIAYSGTNFGTDSSRIVWSNLASWGGLNSTVMLEDGNGPIVTNTGPSAGLYCVDFTSAGYAGNHFMQCLNGSFTKINGSNQPNTIFIVATDKGHTGNGAVLLDANVGGTARTKMVLASDGSGGYVDIGGGFFLTYKTVNTGNYFIYTWCANGASSYVRTNGVKAASGTVNAGALSFPVIGADAIDNPAIAAYEGKVWAVLFYYGAMNTNDMIAVERALNCQGGLGYTIPGP